MEKPTITIPRDPARNEAHDEYGNVAARFTLSSGLYARCERCRQYVHRGWGIYVADELTRYCNNCVTVRESE